LDCAEEKRDASGEHGLRLINRKSPIKGHVKRNIPLGSVPIFLFRHSAQLFDVHSRFESGLAQAEPLISSPREAQERFLFPVVPYRGCGGAIRLLKHQASQSSTL
jgi:hypothetical protein